MWQKHDACIVESHGLHAVVDASKDLVHHLMEMYGWHGGARRLVTLLEKGEVLLTMLRLPPWNEEPDPATLGAATQQCSSIVCQTSGPSL